jgi:hypothetical protein
MFAIESAFPRDGLDTFFDSPLGLLPRCGSDWDGVAAVRRIGESCLDGLPRLPLLFVAQQTAHVFAGGLETALARLLFYPSSERGRQSDAQVRSHESKNTKVGGRLSNVRPSRV